MWLFLLPVLAVTAFHLSTLSPVTSSLVVVYLACLMRLCRARTWRTAFYPGLVTGFLVAVLHLTFFTRIFSFGAAALWLVFAFWIGLFTALGRMCLRSLPREFGWLVLPALWTGLEYFRSELYYLRFAWLTPGYLLPPDAPPVA